MAFLDPADLATPADNTAVRLGAQRIRELKEGLKAFLTPMFNLANGAVGAGKVTSAMLAVPDDLTPVVQDEPSGGANVFNSFEVNAKGQVISASHEPLDGASLEEMSVTALALDEDAVTQRSIKNFEVTPEKLSRPERWVRFDVRPLTVTGLAHVGDIATGSITRPVYSGAALSVGDIITIEGVTPLLSSAYNGTFTIIETTDLSLTTTFKYKMLSDPAAIATGAPKLAVHISAMSWHLHAQFWHEDIETLTRDADGLVTVTTQSAHNFEVGDHVRIMGAFNLRGACGEWVVKTRVDAYTFTYFAGYGGDAGNGDDGVTYMTAGLLVPDCTVTSTATGLCTVNFTRAFTYIDYGVVATAGRGAAAPGVRCTASVDAMYYDRVDIALTSAAGALTDCGMVTVHAIGSNEYQDVIPT